MKAKQVNRIMYAAGILILAALTTYLFKWNNLLLNALLIAASIVAGIPTFIKAWQASRLKMFSIELLVTIAVIGALIIGEYVESAAVTFLFLFGAFLEGRSLEKARASLKSLMDMAPLEATVVRDGLRSTIMAEEVIKNDLVIVQTGEKIPIDGRVITGNASVNEAAITGESIPVSKGPDDQVFSGSILDSGYLEVIAEHVGEDTTFAKIIELVEEAQEGKAKTQRFLERFATIYTPGIMVLSVLVWAITQDVHLALTFLVIACPGALVISAPVSIVAGIGNAARNGILIKGGEVMENLAKLNAFVFDKTGTLTKGKPEVTAIKGFGITEEELLLMAAEAEVISEHHLGRAIVKEAERTGLKLLNKPTEVNVLKGRGIEVKLGGKPLFIGNRKGLFQNEISIETEVESYATQQERAGNTAVFIADDKKVLGIISIADTIRDKAKSTIDNLRAAGIKHLVMLTGDNKHTANIVGEQLGLDHIYAELLPEDKALKVKACMGKGIKLAMLGDGVNDAPAIASADVGIAMGVAGTDIAMETADVVLMADNLDKLTHAVKLAKATVRNMKQNMFIAVGTVALLLAGVLTKNVNLASGMLIHELSVLLVILNAIRLVSFNPISRFKRSTSRKEVPSLEEIKLIPER
ncbi:heavy metal translocating P-type ATPase [Gelidibacter sp. F63206]|uniref:heavy metal translocating P-type ATPase n=1 Tax=Gelidibacter sp. F63206 TaxID=2926425 RepID=UPI001FF2C0FA|nr:cation-translocating P-type ATPase [Gelidibacter sp. F63206]MCK0115053.1 cation-translocating P-type ATPase [Gelidibacter sp. F63206]